jgi:hypothetical protein
MTPTSDLSDCFFESLNKDEEDFFNILVLLDLSSLVPYASQDERYELLWVICHELSCQCPRVRVCIETQSAEGMLQLRVYSPATDSVSMASEVSLPS